MSRLIKQIVSLVLTLSCIVTFVCPVMAKAADNHVVLQEVSLGERTDLTFLEGTPGDTHLVYTYKENDKQYKVVEDADAEFKNVNSIVNILDSEGKYVKEETLKLKIQLNGDLVLERTESNGNVEMQRVYTAKEPTISARANDGTTGEWVTITSNGNTYIKNLTIMGIIAALAAVSSSVVGPGIAAFLGAVAGTYFDHSATYAYYTEIYNYMLSSTSVFVIARETIYTNYYSDSARKNYLSNIYYEYDGR